MLFFELELNAMSEEQVQEKMASPKAKNYEPWIKNVRAARDHMLSEDLEKMLHEKSVVGAAAWNRLFDETMASLRFNIGGKMVTEPEAMDIISSSPDAKTRHEAGAEVDRVMKKICRSFL